MIYVRTIYVVMGLFVAAAVFLTAVALRNVTAVSAESTLAAASLMAATAGWLFNSGVTISSEIRDRTFAYLNRYTLERDISARSAELSRLWAADHLDALRSDENAMAGYFLQNYSSGELILAIKELGNVIEEMALAVKFSTVDEDMLYMSMKDLVGLYISRLLPFLCLFRNNPQVPDHPYGTYTSDDIFGGVLWLGSRREARRDSTDWH